jgi:hypothetical protein
MQHMAPSLVWLLMVSGSRQWQAEDGFGNAIHAIAG